MNNALFVQCGVWRVWRMALDALCRALDALLARFDCLGGWRQRFDAKEARKAFFVRLKAMRDFHAFSRVKIPLFIVNA